jgi:hydroxyacylglutathione hydrolase
MLSESGSPCHNAGRFDPEIERNTVRYQIIPVTPYEQNCSVLWCEETREAAVVDPGGDVGRITRFLEAEKLTLKKILVTHGHIDHAGGVAALAERLPAPIEGPHEADAFWIDGMPQQSKMFGFPDVRSFTPDRWLHDGDQVSFGNVTMDVIHCPGHTPGHVVFYHPESKLAFVGDVIFAGSIGRTDFPKGDLNTLLHSIREKLFPLAQCLTLATSVNPTPIAGGMPKRLLGTDQSAD